MAPNSTCVAPARSAPRASTGSRRAFAGSVPWDATTGRERGGATVTVGAGLFIASLRGIRFRKALKIGSYQVRGRVPSYSFLRAALSLLHGCCCSPVTRLSPVIGRNALCPPIGPPSRRLWSQADRKGPGWPDPEPGVKRPSTASQQRGINAPHYIGPQHDCSQACRSADRLKSRRAWPSCSRRSADGPERPAAVLATASWQAIRNICILYVVEERTDASITILVDAFQSARRK